MNVPSSRISRIFTCIAVPHQVAELWRFPNAVDLLLHGWSRQHRSIVYGARVNDEDASSPALHKIALEFSPAAKFTFPVAHVFRFPKDHYCHWFRLSAEVHCTYSSYQPFFLTIAQLSATSKRPIWLLSLFHQPRLPSVSVWLSRVVVMPWD